jgi:hypothetical protein
LDDAEVRLAVAFVAAYAVLLLIAVGSTLLRAVRLLSRERPLPRLLGRDQILLGGHAAGFAGLMFAVIAHNTDIEVLLVNWVWWLVTAVPPVASMAVYIYYEIAVIGH